MRLRWSHTLLIGAFSLLPATASALVFRDVPVTHPAGEAVRALEKRGAVSLAVDFQPDAAISRVAFLKMLAYALLPHETVNSCVGGMVTPAELAVMGYVDVEYASWYGNAVCALQLAQVLLPSGERKLRPEEGWSLAEASVLLARAFGLMEDRALQRSSGQPWYWPAARALGDLRILPADVRSFTHPIRRGEAAIMVHRLLHADVREHVGLWDFVYAEELRDAASARWGFWFRKGASLRYRTAWGVPRALERGADDPWFPGMSSDFRAYFGPYRRCLGHGDCIERPFVFDVFGPEKVRAVLEELAETDAITIIEERWDENATYLLYRQSTGTCTGEGLLGISRNAAYRLFTPCLITDRDLRADWHRLQREFRVLSASDGRTLNDQP